MKHTAEDVLRKVLLWLSRSKRLARAIPRFPIAWRAARRFVAGETIADAVAVAKQLNAQGMSVTLDHLGENVSTRQEAQAALKSYQKAAGAIRMAMVHSGISLKLTAIGLDLGEDVARANLFHIVSGVADLDPPLFVRIDMEGSAYTEATLRIFEDVFSEYPNVGVVIQSCLYRSHADVAKLVDQGAHVRLVKGTYKEPPSIAYPEKAQVDHSYLYLAETLFSKKAQDNGVYPAIATHDEKIINWVKDHVEAQGIPRSAFEFQMLHGIRRDLQSQLVAQGYRVRVYVPYGAQWFPYFMRRLAERPANLGFVIRNILHEG